METFKRACQYHNPDWSSQGYWCLSSPHVLFIPVCDISYIEALYSLTSGATQWLVLCCSAYIRVSKSHFLMKYCTPLFIPQGGKGYLVLCEYPSVITRGHRWSCMMKQKDPSFYGGNPDRLWIIAISTMSLNSPLKAICHFLITYCRLHLDF